MSGIHMTKRISRAVPRGIATTGPTLFSYGFRPFFLGAGLWAMTAMILWIAALAGQIDIGGSYGSHHWHAHEMLFGFSSAVLAGFLLTAVPNWTGRLPVSGWPLAGLFALWCAGRIALLMPDTFGAANAALVDTLFLPTLLFICAREVIAGKKWKDLKVIAGLVALSSANGFFHLSTLEGGHADVAVRLATSAYVVLVMIVGGRIVPSFTRNWLNRFGRVDFPVPYNRFDMIAILAGVLAFGLWVFLPWHTLTAVAAAGAGLLHTVRLIRWRGWTVAPEKLLLVLHIAYAFVPAGLFGIALSALGYVGDYSALHVLTVGAITCMMLAVMTRATRGHTGRALTASRLTVAAYSTIFLSAILRPLGEAMPEAAMHIYAASGFFWIAAFALFLVEYGPMLVRTRRKPISSQ